MEIDLSSADLEVYAVVVPVEIRALPEFIRNDYWWFYGGFLSTVVVWYDTVKLTPNGLAWVPLSTIDN